MFKLEDKLPKPMGKEKIIYSGKILELFEQKMKVGEKMITYECVRRSPSVRVIIDTNDSQELLLTKEYRPELEAWDYRLPGGKVFNTLSKYKTYLKENKDVKPSAKKAALTEIHEECGLNISDPRLFYIAQSGGSTIEWDLYYFISHIDKPRFEEQNLEVGENIEPNWYSYKQVKKLSLNGKISEDRSVAVLLKYLNNHTKGV
ncbi:NUDIX domain-containing protein [Candidatus Dojkabacteria bacterium]|nr:NUDIX domain-containing protein [Candidatus Dojkabacteria bacterium]